MTRTATQAIVLACALFLVGCPNRLNVECKEDGNCDLAPGGLCNTNLTTGNQWCTYPDPECPTGRRWSDLDVGDGVSGTCVEDSSNPPDAGIDADTRTWSEPERLFPQGLFAFSSGVPTVSPNRRELFVTALQQGGTFTDIYYFSRPDATQRWEEVLHNLAEANSTASESMSCLSSTGLELIFTRGSDLYSVRRSSTAATWGTPVPLGFGGAGASLTAGDLTLYHEDTIDCPGERCLRRRTRPMTTSAWGPSSVEVLGSGSGGYQVLEVAQDELTIVLSAPAASNAAPVAISTRPSRNSAWEPIRPITELGAFSIRAAKRSPAGDEMYLTIGPSSDDLEIYVSRLR
jgi:hypothetical protein